MRRLRAVVGIAVALWLLFAGMLFTAMLAMAVIDVATGRTG